MGVEDREWFREGSLDRRSLTSSTSSTQRRPSLTQDPRSLSHREVAWAFVAAGIQAGILVADYVGWLDVPFI
ncbi:MAG TPA: hypothetical protein VIG93_02335 [Gaiellaceae bacterium]